MDTDSTTLLLEAINSESIDDVATLLDEGTDPREPGYLDNDYFARLANRKTVSIKLAFRKGNIHIARMLFDAVDFAGDLIIPLIGSIMYRYEEISEQDVYKWYQLCLEYGYNVNDSFEYGKTVLHVESETGCLKTVKFLLENGASVNIRDRGNQTPLHSCTWLQMFPQGRISGHYRDDHFEIVCELLDRGADINATGSKGNTPLHREEHVEVCMELIMRGADVNVKNDDGNSPLFYAVDSENVTKVLLLLENDAIIDDVVSENEEIHQMLDIARLDRVSRYFEVMRAVKCEVVNLIK